MKKYVALLRGINVGGNKKVSMVELKKLFQSLGFENPKTLLASGNVIFEAEESPIEALTEQLEKTFQKEFGFEIPTIVIPISEIEEYVQKNPFKNIQITKDTRLYVIFLKEKLVKVPEKDEYTKYEHFKVLLVTCNAVFSCLTLIREGQTLKLMESLEREFGKNVTTRNWNTVVKIANL